VIHHTANLFEPFLTIAAGNNNLLTHTKTQPEHKYSKVKNTSQRTGTQRNFPYPAQKSSIGEVNEILCHATKGL